MPLTSSFSVNIGNLAAHNSSVQVSLVCNPQALVGLIFLPLVRFEGSLDVFESGGLDTVVCDPVRLKS